MKNVNPQASKAAIHSDHNKQRPENKDNLDSREGEEQEFKGDDTTHNRKEHKNEKKKSGKHDEQGA